MKRLLLIVALGVLVLTPTVDAKVDETKLPPAWRTWLEVCAREQPKPGRFDVTKWSTPNWTNTVNWGYPGGCGLTRENYADIRRPGWPKTMDRLPARLQLWAVHYLFWKHARIGQKMLGSYEAGQRYGSTVWDVHDDMGNGRGWYGFKRDGKTWQ